MGLYTSCLQVKTSYYFIRKRLRLTCVFKLVNINNMEIKTLEEKIEMVRATRARNYEESLRLEGFPENSPSHGKTKTEIIEYYSRKSSK